MTEVKTQMGNLLDSGSIPDASTINIQDGEKETQTFDTLKTELTSKKKLHIGLLLPSIKYKHVLPSYLKLSNFISNKGHTFELGYANKLPSRVPDICILSTVFSFHSKKYRQILDLYTKYYSTSSFFVGGVFASNHPVYFKTGNNVTVCGGVFEELDMQDYDFSLFPEVRKLAINTSRGCVNSCTFCCVPKLEGKMKSDSPELVSKRIRNALRRNSAINGIVVLDNNFSCHKYFFEIVEILKVFNLPVDFSQGLDCTKMTEEHMRSLSTLQFGSQSDKGTHYIRFAFDKDFQASGVESTLELVKKYNFSAKYFAYCLYNFKESPQEFFERVVTAHQIATKVGIPIFLFPQEYEPLTVLSRHTHVGEKWTHVQLKGLRKLLTHLRGFLPVGYMSVFNWIGKNPRSFVRHIEAIGKGQPPSKVIGE